MIVSAKGSMAAAGSSHGVRCSVCGCTEERGCAPCAAGRSCWWIGPALCSRCDPLAVDGVYQNAEREVVPMPSSLVMRWGRSSVDLLVARGSDGYWRCGWVAVLAWPGLYMPGRAVAEREVRGMELPSVRGLPYEGRDVALQGAVSGVVGVLATAAAIIRGARHPLVREECERGIECGLVTVDALRAWSGRKFGVRSVVEEVVG